MTLPARLLAMYLPQFHPIPENDAWWGNGFTEWTNVAKAKPMFPGHYQPHIPADLGFYDLRVPETRKAQADLAREYGIEGFCYYHYWFAGKVLLQRPLAEVVASGQPDYPFCVCWANQSWTGIWHGAPDRVLIEQTYPGDEDHRAHFQYLLPAFRDRRYVTVDGRPLFLLYRPMQIPELSRVIQLWRRQAREAGLPGLHVVGIHDDPRWDPTRFGLDGATCQRLPSARGWISKRTPASWMKQRLDVLRGRPTVIAHRAAFDSLLAPAVADFPSYPMVTHAWDNSPRSEVDGVVVHDTDVELFRRLIRHALDLRSDAPTQHRLVFLKSWNEWAEGNHLEPDREFGYQFLEVVRDEWKRGR